jgi:hypothetical protein
MTMTRLAVGAAALALCACASVPMARPERDLEAKRFEVPPDQALLYVYRDETFGSAIKFTVLVDGQHVGDTAAHTFLLVPVAAGTHEVVSKSEKDSTVEFTAENGKAYFVWQEVKMGLFAARTQLHVVPADQGTKAVTTCSLAEAPAGLHYPLAALAPTPGAVAASATPAQASTPSGAQPATVNGAQAMTAAAPASSDDGFPRVLSGADIAGHFARHSNQDAQAGRQTFQLIVKQDNSIERVCPGCRVTQGSGEIKYEADRVCIHWTRVTFPDSGCYQLVQTAGDRFVLRGLKSERAIHLSVRE